MNQSINQAINQTIKHTHKQTKPNKQTIKTTKMFVDASIPWSVIIASLNTVQGLIWTEAGIELNYPGVDMDRGGNRAKRLYLFYWVRCCLLCVAGAVVRSLQFFVFAVVVCCCLLFVVCRLSFAVRSLLVVVCCLSFVDGWLLFVVCCVLLFVVTT